MICTACYRDLPPGAAYCPHCGARVSRRDAAAGTPGPPAPAAAPGGNSWERRGARSWIAALGETLQESLFRPAAFFRGTATAGGTGAALGYAALVGTFSFAVAMLWQRALGDRLAMELGGRHLDLLDHRSALAGLTLLLPVGVVVLALVQAALLHVALAVLGGARAGYGATLKAVCYSWSAMAFNVFPVCGAALAAVWQAVLQVVGLRELHRTSTARAFWAWFLPFVVAFCLAAVLVGAALLGLAKVWHQLVGGQFEV